MSSDVQKMLSKERGNGEKSDESRKLRGEVQVWSGGCIEVHRKGWMEQCIEALLHKQCFEVVMCKYKMYFGAFA